MSTIQDVINPITIKNYIRDQWDNAIARVVGLGLLVQKGHVRKHTGGDPGSEWPVYVGQSNILTTHYDQDVSAEYKPIRRHERAILDWGQKSAFERLSKGAMKRNGGEAALVRYGTETVPNMIRDLIAQGTQSPSTGKGSLSADLIALDGGTYSGSGLPLYGFPSIFKFDTSSTAKETTVTSGSTYAGLSLESTGLGSDILSDTVWTPKGINTHAASAWSLNTATNGLATSSGDRYAVFEILSYAINELSYDPADEKFRPDCGIMDKLHFLILRNALGDKQKFWLKTNDDSGKVFGGGTSTEYAMHDGLPFYQDRNMPASTTYITNFDQIWLDYLPQLAPIAGDKSPVKKSKAGGDGGPRKGGLAHPALDIFDVEVDYDRNRRGVAVSVTADLKYRINPRYQGKIADFS